MPNILAGERIVPELLQENATPEKLAAALVALVSDEDARERLDARFEAIRTALRQNTEEKAAAAILPLLSRVRAA
jgi:lipid-A-disaccharide synthase